MDNRFHISCLKNSATLQMKKDDGLEGKGLPYPFCNGFQCLSSACVEAGTSALIATQETPLSGSGWLNVELWGFCGFYRLEHRESILQGKKQALGGLLFGDDIGTTSGATISLQSPQLSGTTWFKLSAIQLGRRRELISAALLYVLGTLITALAPDLGVLLAGRLLYGLGIGLVSFKKLTTIAYVLSSKALSSFNVHMPYMGLPSTLHKLALLKYLGYFVGNFQINAIGGWPYMYGFSAQVALLMGVGMWSLPPSPCLLLLRAVQGKGPLLQYKKEATLALSKLRGWSPNDEASES
ncbi:hypothetical protein SLEP1_g41496 [Rubroshorea leprosula]|uniref:Uncharacterized protein n=1 Tax=Rubroshorea leprosula TaxID=152421 RepID=A0AAV5L6P1_9ROSI|nr:hypothetical protein SLEP1_g41496 [Rubroshorea leprosula]